MFASRHGHEIVALVNLRPPHSISIQNEAKNNADEISICQELDSYMYCYYYYFYTIKITDINFLEKIGINQLEM